jgi:hypothetical protein
VPAAAECNRALASKHRIAPAANAALAEGEEPEFARDEAAHGKAVSGDASSAAQIAEAIDCAVVVFQKVSVPKELRAGIKARYGHFRGARACSCVHMLTVRSSNSCRKGGYRECMQPIDFMARHSE